MLIWYLRGYEKAQKIINLSIPFKISLITYLELVQGMRDKRELRTLQKCLKQWSTDIIQINESVSIQAMFLIEDYYLSHSLEIADAIIAATALGNDEILLTANEKHYKFIPNLKVQVFNIK